MLLEGSGFETEEAFTDLYAYQLKTYETLTASSKTNPNINVIAVLGVYHSAVKKESKYVFIDPSNERILFEKQELWDRKFREIWENAKLRGV